MDLYNITKSLNCELYLLYQIYNQKMLAIIGQLNICYSQL